MKTLFVANGDAALENIERSPGTTYVAWGEALMDGPIASPHADVAFWQMREAFVVDAYGAPEGSYRTKIIDTFNLITESGQWDTIELHFDEDLFCVINCSCLLYHLKPLAARGTTLLWPLISSSPILRKELDEIANLWRHYASNNVELIQDIVSSQDLQQLHKVYAAYANHLRRIPAISGTDIWPHVQLQSMLKNSSNKDQVVRDFLIYHNAEFGYGDIQIRRILESL